MLVETIRIYGPTGEFGAIEEYTVGGKILKPNQNAAGKVTSVDEVGEITDIIETEMPGAMAMIPYIEVWCGTSLYASFCRHNIVGVYYKLGEGSEE